MDADAVATNRMLLLIRDRPYEFPPLNIEIINGFEAWHVSREQEVRLWWRSVYALLRLTAARVSGTELFASHPTPQMRQLMIAGNVFDHWGWTGLPTETEKGVLALFGSGAADVENALRAILLNPLDDTGLRVAVKEIGSHTGRLLKAYSSAYDSLRVHAYTDRLVPPSPPADTSPSKPS